MIHSGCTRDLEELALEPQNDTFNADFAAPTWRDCSGNGPLMLPMIWQDPPVPSSLVSFALPGTPSTPAAKALLAPSTPIAKLTPAPTTPMKLVPAPSTPLASRDKCSQPSSPPPAPRVDRTPLLRFLQNEDVEQVRQCLASEPEATSQLFFDCGFEPALCCAIRHGCHPRICQLLLQHGADAFAFDTRGYTPMTCLASLHPEVPSTLKSFGIPSDHEQGLKSKRKRFLEVARLLVEAGVHPQALDAEHRSAVTVARASGNHSVLLFLENYLEVQASIALLRAQGGQTPFGRLTVEVVQVIVAHLLPKGLVVQVRLV